MKCIHDELIQKYIDGEATLEEKAFIDEHISACEKCVEKLEHKQGLSIKMKAAINLLSNNQTDIPEFIQSIPLKKGKSIKLKRYIYSLSAACILILFFLFLYHGQDRVQTESLQVNIIYDLESEYDANLPPSEQEMVIQILDPDGKLTIF